MGLYPDAPISYGEQTALALGTMRRRQGLSRNLHALASVTNLFGAPESSALTGELRQQIRFVVLYLTEHQNLSGTGSGILAGPTELEWRSRHLQLEIKLSRCF